MLQYYKFMNNLDTDNLFSEKTDYKKGLGLFEAIWITVNKVIGSGIFRTPAPIMALVACTSLFGLVWVLGAIITLLSIFCYAELVGMIPKSGGPYAILKAAYPPIVAFLRGWAMFFVSETAAIVAVAFVFAEYSNAMWALVYGSPFSKYIEVILCFATIWGLTFINCFGIAFSGIIQNIFGIAKSLAIAAIISMAFLSPLNNGSFSHFSEPFWPSEFSWATVLAVGAALRYAFFAFSGWEGATYLAEEVKNPRRNLPLALFLGISGVFLLYLGANVGYLYQLPVEMIKVSKSVATDTLKMAIGGTGGAFIAAAVMLNTFGNVSTQVLCKARSWQVMARDGMFFKSFAPLHPQYKTPNNALILQASWATVILIFASFSKNSYEAIIDYFACTGIMFNVLTFMAVFVLRKKYPDVLRPFKAPFYPWSLIIVVFLYLIYLVITLITAFWPSLLGILLTLTGLIYYYFVIRKNNRLEA